MPSNRPLTGRLALNRGVTGRYHTTSVVGGEAVRAFVPEPLPPRPALEIGPELRELLDAALLALGRLDSVTVLLPDTRLFIYTYVRKEAVLSSQIEGTQSSLADLLIYEAEEEPGVPLADVVEVSGYVAALEHGISRVRDGFPICNRLFREIHGILLAQGRGASRAPGEFRRTQNWIGGTRPGDAAFVPPPPELVPDCMGALERWLHDEPERTPILLKAALAHVQFETIHPFLDGNGRIGRLLMSLLLTMEGVLREPLLYLSLYLKQRRAEYYALLDRVRSEGDWEGWLKFFAEGVTSTAGGAVTTAQRLVSLFAGHREEIRGTGRGAGSALRVHQALEQRPIASIGMLSDRTGLSFPAVTRALGTLERLGIVREFTGRRRNRLFSYHPYLEILNQDTP